MRDRPPEALGEFETIARLLRPLTRGAPEALDLADDAAVLPARPGFDLVISKDAMVAGVHFLANDPLDLVARKLLRTNLSDLAAKAAEPFGYFLMTAWPHGTGDAAKARFAEGLAADGETFGLALLGGDTVSTPGPLTLSATILGYMPAGRMAPRAGAQVGDVIMVSGTIGDGWLGLAAAQGLLPGLDPAHAAWLADRYRLPQPRIGMAEALRAHAHAALDVSDGLVADLGWLAKAGGVGIELDLDALPLSDPARAWLAGQGDRREALARLATGGDDYEIACAIPPDALEAFRAKAGVPITVVGQVTTGQGVSVTCEGRTIEIARPGWSHS